MLAIGHGLVLLVFISAFLSWVCYLLRYKGGWGFKGSFYGYGTAMLHVHLCGILGIAGILLYLLVVQDFSAHYVWSHSTLSLPIMYRIGALWEGQEGSLLVWLFWHALVGVWVVYRGGRFRGRVMVIWMGISVFLCSHLLGWDIWGVHVGSSPFLRMNEAIKAPIFSQDSGFIPSDGSGLSPLLQNYWMLIHPPVLFLGFALIGVPFCYALGYAWSGIRFHRASWVHYARKGALLSLMVLGLGIVMGAIWAYETLNFGGYWNWDPVENAVYIPWLVMVAALHALLLAKRGKAIRLAWVSSVLPFVLVVYASFLIRSGILGDSSVHAFTGSGLGEQLLIFLCVCVCASIGFGWRFFGVHAEKESLSFAWHKVEGWLLAGILLICLAAFQILVPTSLSVINVLGNLLGGAFHFAPPADAVAFYTPSQLVFALAMLILAGVGQVLWWRRVQSKEMLWSQIRIPFISALIVCAVMAGVWGVKQWVWTLLLSVAIFSFLSSLRLIWHLRHRERKHLAGILAHIGVVLMVVGILFSSGYSQVISINDTGRVWHPDFPSQVNEKNMLLFQDEWREMRGYRLRYHGKRYGMREVSGYVSSSSIRLLGNGGRAIWVSEDEKRIKRGDTLRMDVDREVYFEIEYEKGGKSYRLYPRARTLSAEEVIYSPYILRHMGYDVYMHVRTFFNKEQQVWSSVDTVEVGRGEVFFINDYVAKLTDIYPVDMPQDLSVMAADWVAKAHIEIQGARRYYAEPLFLLYGDRVGAVADEIEEISTRVKLIGIDPKKEVFTLVIEGGMKPWVIVEIVKKPLINALWLGAVIMLLGMGMGIIRR